jgi:hypothetical protein
MTLHFTEGSDTHGRSIDKLIFEISVTDVNRNFRVSGSITIGSIGELFRISDGIATRTNRYLILNEISTKPSHALHPKRLGKLEGHSTLGALDDLDGIDGIRSKLVYNRALVLTSCQPERDIIFTGAGRSRWSRGCGGGDICGSKGWCRCRNKSLARCPRGLARWNIRPRDSRGLVGTGRHLGGTEPRVNTVTVTIILRRGSTGNETRWVVGDAFTFWLSSFVRGTWIVLELKLTTIRIVRIDKALD